MELSTSVATVVITRRILSIWQVTNSFMVMYMYDHRRNRTKMKTLLELSTSVATAFMARRMLLMQEVQLSYKYIDGYVHV